MSSLPNPLFPLHNLASAGCNGKLRASDLLHLLNRDGDVEQLALYHDAGTLSRSPTTLFTIDSVSPLVREPEELGKIAVIHALNDLYSQAATPVGVSVAYAVTDVSLGDGTARRVLAGVSAALEAIKVPLAKAHTLRASEFLVTVAAVGEQFNPLPSIVDGDFYSVILTKPIGSAFCYNVATLLGDDSLTHASLENLQKDHHTLVPLFRKYCFNGTTDITGFGLIGHMCCMADHLSREVIIRTNDVPIVSGALRLDGTTLPECSAERNRIDFERFVYPLALVTGLKKLLLYTGETSGPIACVIKSSDITRFVASLLNAGFGDAKAIGTIIPSTIPKVTLA